MEVVANRTNSLKDIFISGKEKFLFTFVVTVFVLSSTKLLGISNDAGFALRVFQALSVASGLIYFFIFNWKTLALSSFTARTFIFFVMLILLLIPRAVYTNITLGVPLGEMARNFLFFFNVIFFFVFLQIIRNKSQYEYFNRIITVLAVFAVFAIFYVLTSSNYINVDSGTTRVILGRTRYDAFRLIIPTNFLIAYAYFYTLTKVIFKVHTKSDYLMLLILAFGTLVQLHRTVIISMLFCTILVIALSLKGVNPKRLLTTVAFAGIVFIILGAIAFKSGYFGEDYFQSQLEGTTEDLTNGEGSFFLRFFIFINTWSDVLANYPILGRGLHWLEMDEEVYLLFFESYSPSGDNTFTNVLLVFGFSGFILFFFLVAVTLLKMWRLFKAKNIPAKMKPKLLHILIFLIYLMLNAWSSSTIVSPTNIMTIVSFAASAILIELCREREPQLSK